MSDGQPPQPPSVGLVRFSQIADHYARALSLDAEPAVYAWYRDINAHLVGCNSGAQLLKALDGLLRADLSPRKESGPPFLYRLVTWEHGGDLNDPTRNRLHSLCDEPDGVERLTNLLRSAAIFQSPLYIGKASNLRRRIGEHVTGSNSDLRELLQGAGIKIQQCMVRYFYMDDPLWRDDQTVTAVEELLTRLAPAAFVRRPG